MSTNTLATRAAGDTILAGFFNDFNTALNGDFVGRNTSGVPTSGQNLGTAAIPWGTIRASGLVVGGSSVDTSVAARPAFCILSGKKRSTSNQPAFIKPNGAAASFLLEATSTNLVVNINGSSVTISADITKSSLTTAPSANNTCLVNDSTAADQEDTKLWGEINHRKTITVDTMGANMSSEVGKIVAIKIDNGSAVEYAIGLLESTTKISKLYRGFFYNSSYAPINRIVFSDNDVITIMKLGWIFMDSDGTTVDVSYTTPHFGYSSPSSPATGDYWFDSGTVLWKRYDGASFVSVNRTLIGLCVQDSSNCVAARSFDFDARYSPYNTVELEVSTTEIVKAISEDAKVNVYGREIYLGKNQAAWNITTNLATSADMYNATEQASTMYYLYVTDYGQLYISDISPHLRPDLQGEYHPHNPWRCVGLAYNNGSSNITQAASKYKNKTYVYVDTGNGHGAVNTKIRRYTTTVSALGSIVYADSANLGASFTCFEEGLYAVSYADAFSAGSSQHGVSRSSTELTTNIDALVAVTDRVGLTTTTSGLEIVLTCLFRAKIGDVIRPHSRGNQNGVGVNNYFQISKVAE